MSQTTISPHLIQLYNIESRIVDQLLIQTKENRKSLQKPEWLRYQKLPSNMLYDKTKRKENANLQNTQPHNSCESSVEITPEVNKQETNLIKSANFSFIDNQSVCLTKESFTTQDSISSGIDKLHLEISLNLPKPRLKLMKPKWLNVNLSKFGNSLCVSGIQSIENPSEKHNNSNLTSKNYSCYAIKDCWKRTVAIETSIISQGKNPKHAKSFSLLDSASKARIVNNFCGTSSHKLSIVEPEPTVGLLTDVFSLAKESGKRSFDSINKENDTESADSGYEGNGNEWSCNGSLSDDSSRPDSKRQKLSPDCQQEQESQEKHKQPVIMPKGFRKQRAKFSPKMQTVKQISRCRRQPVKRTFNMQCISCKHRVISTECSICNPLNLAKEPSLIKGRKTISKMPNMKTLKSRNRTNMKAVEKTRKAWNKRALARTKSVFVSKKRNYDMKTNRPKTLVRKNTQCKRRQKSKPKCLQEQPKNLHINESCDKSKCKEETLLKVKNKLKSSNTETSILEHHKQLSADLSVFSSNESLSSAKDMFSQLCKLEEHSRNYDAGTFQQIMPERPVKITSTKTGSVYSSTDSHVGGIWRSIFTRR